MGLIGGMARTAVIAGTATAVSNRVSRRQANRWAQQEQAEAYQQQAYAQEAYAQAPPPPPPAPAADDRYERLAELGKLKEQGLLTDAEFAAEKARILGGY